MNEIDWLWTDGMYFIYMSMILLCAHVCLCVLLTIEKLENFIPTKCSSNFDVSSCIWHKSINFWSLESDSMWTLGAAAPLNSKKRKRKRIANAVSRVDFWLNGAMRVSPYPPKPMFNINLIWPIMMPITYEKYSLCFNIFLLYVYCCFFCICIFVKILYRL